MSDPVMEKYPNPPADMLELLQRIEIEWRELKDWVLALSEEQLTMPGKDGWSVKDHLAHRTFWEQMMVRSHLGDEPQHAVMGLTEAEAARLDSEDKINDLTFRRSRKRAASDVLAEAWRIHDDTVAAIERQGFARLHQQREGYSYPLYVYVVGNTYGHYMEHAGWLRGQMGLRS
jgi:hypothetical protein